jgi:hypothetical protein
MISLKFGISPSQLLLDEVTYRIHRLSRFGEHGSHQGITVDHFRCRHQSDVHVCPFSFCGEAGRVIQHGVIITHINVNSGQTAQVTMERRDPV